MKKILPIILMLFLSYLSAEPIQWEYMVAELPYSNFEEDNGKIVTYSKDIPFIRSRLSGNPTMEKMLDDLGANGWELISISDGRIATFKRIYNDEQAEKDRIQRLHVEYCYPITLSAIEDEPDKERIKEIENYLGSLGMKANPLFVMNQETYFEIHTILPVEYYGVRNSYSKDEVRDYLLALRPYIYEFPVGDDKRIEGTIAVGFLANPIQHVGFINFVYTVDKGKWDINIGV